jgi:hypothetical protein
MNIVYNEIVHGIYYSYAFFTACLVIMCTSVVAYNKSFNPCDANVGFKWNIEAWMISSAISDLGFVVSLSIQIIWQHSKSDENIKFQYKILFRISRAIYITVGSIFDILGLILVLNYDIDCHNKQHQLWIFMIDILIARCCRYAITIFGIGAFIFYYCSSKRRATVSTPVQVPDGYMALPMDDIGLHRELCSRQNTLFEEHVQDRTMIFEDD